MNTLALLMLCLAPALQDGWKDTHRVHLRNGNFIDGVLVQLGDKDILFRWSPGVLMRIKIGDIKGDVEEIKIRTLHTPARTVAIRETAPEPDAPGPMNVKAPVRDPGSKPIGPVDKLFTTLMNKPETAFEDLAAAVKALGPDGARAIIAELPEMDERKAELGIVSLDQMRDLPIDRDVRALLDSKRPDLRAGAIRILGNRGTPESGRYLAPMLQDPVASVRMAALMALPSFSDAGLLAPIAELAIDPDANVRARAINSAEELSRRVEGTNELAQRWLSLLGRGPADAAPEIAAGLNRLATRNSEGFPREDVRSAFTRLLTDRDPGSRAAGVFALSTFKPEEQAIDPIFETFQAERDPKVLVQCCEALGRLRALKSIDGLVEKLRDDSKEVRAAAQRSLEKIAGNTDFGSDYDKWREWADKRGGENR